MPLQHWLVKQEPSDYSWSDFVRDGATEWTGVRNYAARNNLRAMKRRDAVLFYHSGDDKSIVGLARVQRAAYPDPTAASPEEGWVAVGLAPVKAAASPVTLAALKADPALRDMVFVRQSRLSVSPVTPAQFARLGQLAGF